MQFVAALLFLSSSSNASSLFSYQDQKTYDLNNEIVELSTENNQLKAKIKDLNNHVNNLADELKDVDAC